MKDTERRLHTSPYFYQSVPRGGSAMVTSSDNIRVHLLHVHALILFFLLWISHGVTELIPDAWVLISGVVLFSSSLEMHASFSYSAIPSHFIAYFLLGGNCSTLLLAYHACNQFSALMFLLQHVSASISRGHFSSVRSLLNRTIIFSHSSTRL